ncbi:MAG: hypothetical protein AAGI09_10030 [Pseudomonadota bacterium]
MFRPLPPLRIAAILCLSLFLTACEVASSGAITYQGQPIKTEIRQIDNGLIVVGYDVYLNNELIGRTQPLPDQDNPVFAANAKVELAPLPSRFGTVTVERAFSYGATSFDIYINGTYAGTVQMPAI